MATDDSDAARIERLEKRVEELEARDDEGRDAAGSRAAAPWWAEWTRRVRLSGSSNLGVYGGQRDSVTASDAFDAWDARFFIDAELDEAVRFLDATLVRNIGFSFEWNLVRNGMLFNDVGNLYVDFQGIGDSPWFNARAGRFQTPVGEAYKRYGRGYRDKPFVSNTLGGPWWWDEGVMLYGGPANDRFGYLASITNGDTEFNGDLSVGPQLTFKFWGQPCEQIYLSASALWTGELGSADGGLWLGEAWARPLGSGTPVPSVIDGAVAAPDPLLGNSWLIAGDVVLTPWEPVRLWLAGGRFDIESQGSPIYDRVLYYWIAELVVDGDAVLPELAPFYLGVRADGLGTFDNDRGYVLDIRQAFTLGYNVESYKAFSAVVGWKLARFVTLRAEYSHRKLELVRGAAAVVFGGSDRADTYALEVGVYF